MVIGKDFPEAELGPILINGISLDYVTEYKYLGVVLCSGRSLSFSATSTIRSFHRAANALFYSPVKPKNIILLKLLYSNCVPIITYACAVREFSSADMYRCHVAINNAIRKIYSYAVWQSIRHIRIENGFESIYEIFTTARDKFANSALTSSNSIVSHLATNAVV